MSTVTQALAAAGFSPRKRGARMFKAPAVHQIVRVDVLGRAEVRYGYDAEPKPCEVVAVRLADGSSLPGWRYSERHAVGYAYDFAAAK